MNAPATAGALLAPTDQILPLAAITPSGTHIQELRRARFDKKLLQELADSIKSVGVLQPVVVRPLEKSGKYELVAGERRWLASKLAGATEIRASVCVLTADQVLEVQLIENLQREGLHELEEAEGYEELMKLKKISADAVADMVGRSRSYVFKRTKLLALCQDARKAFYAGEMDASTALLIARIPGEEFQKRAMKELAEQREYGEVTNFKQASEFVRDRFMLRLKQAPFDPADEQLVAVAGSCQKCPKRTGNQRDLFGDVKDGDLCTDAKCFDDKRQAHYAGARKRLEAQGKKVIHGEAAKKILPHWENNSGNHCSGGYTSLDEHSYDLGGTVRQALPKDFEPTLIQHPFTGKIFEAASTAAITKARLKSKRGAKDAGGGSYNYGRAKASGPDVDEQLTDRLAELIHKNAPKSFGKAWLLDLVKEVYERLSLRDEPAVAKAWGWPENAFDRGKLPAQAAKLGERDLVLLMFHLVFAVGPYTREGVLKLFGIKEQATRETVIEERKEAAKKAREDAKAAKGQKAAKKKGGAK